MQNKKQKTALVTGSAGFIGYHISRELLDDGWRVIGLDCMSDYYDVSLKEEREHMLLQNQSYISIHEKIETKDVLMSIFKNELPDTVIHLAAQAGVRFSIKNPRAYLESNIQGTFELLEAARAYPPEHMLIASTSSVYGASKKMPFKETDKADHQVSFYAATKKSTENMAHSYSHLFNLPITMFRFFTVYGPWSRPDMAPIKFAKAIFNNDPIDVYNYGDMDRDFTYIDDLVSGIRLLMDTIPLASKTNKSELGLIDSKSAVASFRVVNIGNSKPKKLLEFIEAIEKAVGRKAIRNLMPMQEGDLMATWADISLLERLTGYKPKTDLLEGTEKFIKWYRSYYDV